MKYIFTLFAAFVLLNGATAAQTKPNSVKPIVAVVAENDLTAQLPAADFVATMNLKRLLTEVLPQFMASKPADLNGLNQGIDDIKAKIGVDLREFEQAALAVNYKKPGANSIELEPLVLMRGSFKPAALIGAAKFAANGKFRQETVNGKSIVIFNLPAIVKPTGAKSNPIEKMIDKMLSGELAVVALDNNTLALGKPAQVRASFANAATKTRMNKDFADHLARKPAAVMNFAGNISPELIGMANLGNDQFGSLIASLQQVYGTIDTNGSDAALALAAQTATPAQAQELSETLQGLQMLGKGFLGSKADAKNQAIARVLENLTITQNSNRVQLEAIVPPDVLSAIIK